MIELSLVNANIGSTQIEEDLKVVLCQRSENLTAHKWFMEIWPYQAYPLEPNETRCC